MSPLTGDLTAVDAAVFSRVVSRATRNARRLASDPAAPSTWPRIPTAPVLAKLDTMDDPRTARYRVAAWTNGTLVGEYYLHDWEAALYVANAALVAHHPVPDDRRQVHIVPAWTSFHAELALHSGLAAIGVYVTAVDGGLEVVE